jgi:hypothetical protein
MQGKSTRPERAESREKVASFRLCSKRHGHPRQRLQSAVVPSKVINQFIELRPVRNELENDSFLWRLQLEFSVARVLVTMIEDC